MESLGTIYDWSMVRMDMRDENMYEVYVPYGTVTLVKA